MSLSKSLHAQYTLAIRSMTSEELTLLARVAKSGNLFVSKTESDVRRAATLLAERGWVVVRGPLVEVTNAGRIAFAVQQGVA